MTSPALRAPSPNNYARDFYFLAEVFNAASNNPVTILARVRALLDLAFDPVSLAFGISGAMKFPQTAETYQNLNHAANYLAQSAPNDAETIAAIVSVGATVPDGMVELPTGITGAEYIAGRGARGWESERGASDFGIFIADDGALLSFDPPQPDQPDTGDAPPPIVCADGRTFPGGGGYLGGSPCFDESAQPTRQTCPDGVTTYDPRANYLVDPCAQRQLPAPIDESERLPESKSALPLVLGVAAAIYLATQ